MAHQTHYAIVLVVVALISTELTSARTVTISTSLGAITGAELESDRGLKFWAFRGIPYARPPVKNLRFKPPEPVEPWSGTLDATEDGSPCIQIDLFATSPTPTLLGDEDCLFINVYTPHPLKNETLLPVMVYFHGGGYTSGHGSTALYGPHRLMDKGVILVTLNYRLGPFGFLSTGDEASPGNYGLLDQTLALKWVQRYIEHFGGDADKVTIFGQSAGGASVSFHMLSPLSKGLFHAAIQQSGNGLCEWAVDLDDPLPNAQQLGRYLECSTESNQELIKCLRKRPALDVLIKFTHIILHKMQNLKDIFLFRPRIDQVSGANAFLPKAPKQMLSSGNVNSVPTLSGFTSDEGIQIVFMMSPVLGGIDNINSGIIKRFLSLLSPNVFSDETNEAVVLEKIKSAYFKNIDESDVIQRLTAVAKIISGGPDRDTDDANQLLAQQGIPTYAYKFSYRGSQTWIETTAEYSSLPPEITSSLKLVGHMDELPYLFRSSYFKSTQLSESDSIVAEIMLNLWTNFAKTKNPRISADGGPDGVSWSPIDPSHPKYLNIDLNPSVVDGYLSENYSFWSELQQIDANIKTEL